MDTLVGDVYRKKTDLHSQIRCNGFARTCHGYSWPASMFFEEDEENANDDIEERQIIEEDPYVNVSRRIKECLISVFQIGLLCSKTSPNEQIPTNVVVNEMNTNRDKFLKLEKKNRRRRGRQMS